jgi:hypothetical protein
MALSTKVWHSARLSCASHSFESLVQSGFPRNFSTDFRILQLGIFIFVKCSGKTLKPSLRKLLAHKAVCRTRCLAAHVHIRRTKFKRSANRRRRHLRKTAVDVLTVPLAFPVQGFRSNWKKRTWMVSWAVRSTSLINHFGATSGASLLVNFSRAPQPPSFDVCSQRKL